MAIQFPTSPTEGQEFNWGSYTYRYTNGKWIGVNYATQE